MPDADLLAEIERGIDDVVAVPTLLAQLDACAALADAPGETGIRYRVARAIVENRNGLYRSALTLLQQARDAAIRDGFPGQLARISREAARVYSWRGNITAASMELLRSIAELEAAGTAAGRGGEGTRADRAAALAEIGRLDIEAGRYEAALPALEEAARYAVDLLPRREPGRIALNRCESLFALGRIDECERLIDQSEPLVSNDFPRDLFNLRLLKARCLLERGRDDEAAAVARDAHDASGRGEGSYETAEWQLFEGLLKRRQNPEAAVAALREALLRFADDDLPRHEVEAGIRLADILADIGRLPEAEAAIADALKRARDLPGLADRVRAAAIRFWQPEKRADLAGDNAVSSGAGGRGGRFLVMATLGSGGFGSVQRAIDTATGEEVAIKRLRPDRGQTASAAKLIDGTVRNEVTAAARVPARFAARTRYLNLDPSGELVLVQDFVEGPTLRKVLEDGAADLGRRLAIAAQLARAVAALHQRGVVHRDLKPENVILRNGTDPILIDLGLASLMGTGDVFSGMGTPGYAPPEQWKAGTSAKYPGSEDVYALGRMVDELGGAPRPDGRWGARLTESVRRVLGRESRLNDRLRRIVDRMTESDPARRDVDLGELAGLLDEAAAESRRDVSPPQPPPPPPGR